MEKRYQVFVSSTYEDLKEERESIIQALLELDCIPSGMELFPAADEDQWSLIKRVIDDCDYYIVVIGGRYGSLASSGKSYTQEEFEYAASKGKPILRFLHKDPGSIPVSKTERYEKGRAKLKAFRHLLEQRVCKSWTTPVELGSQVKSSLIKLINEKPAIGWVRANQTLDSSATYEIMKLREKVKELENIIQRGGDRSSDFSMYAPVDDSILGEWHFRWVVEKPRNYSNPVVTEKVHFLKVEGNIIRGFSTGSPVGDYDIVGYLAPHNLSFSYKPKDGIYSGWTGAALLLREQTDATEMRGRYMQYRQGKPTIQGTVKAIKYPVPPANR